MVWSQLISYRLEQGWKKKSLILLCEQLLQELDLMREYFTGILVTV